jgi:nicotinate-nucleotide pyrophosphorylase (carboxylating)
MVPKSHSFKVNIHAWEDIAVSGIDLAADFFLYLDPKIKIDTLVRDCQKIKKGAPIMRLEGNARAILTAEWSALNVLQHLSGIATLTSRYVEELEGTGTALLDTRKTTSGLRRLEKYTTICGGARNHRLGLYDAILIKDNHIAAAGGIRKAIRGAKVLKPKVPLEVECDTLAQLEIALKEDIDLVLLDNMSLRDLRKAVKMAKGKCKIEASGNVILETIHAIALTGVEYISTSKITQGAPAVDIGLDYSD